MVAEPLRYDGATGPLTGQARISYTSWCRRLLVEIPGSIRRMAVAKDLERRHDAIMEPL